MARLALLSLAFLMVNLHLAKTQAAYPLVPFENDTLIPFGYSGPITLTIPVPFLGTNETVLHVNEDGILSFKQEFYDSYPNHFDLVQAAVIAPFWYPVGRFLGSIYYRLSTNDSDFTELQQILTTAFSLEDFEITQTLVATYDSVKQSTYRSGNNSFQVVLATDGEKSFVIFSYGNITEQYSRANIGFNSGDRSYMLPGALTSAVQDIETSSNVGVAGLYLFRVDQECYIEQPSQDLCQEDFGAPTDTGILNTLRECTNNTNSGERIIITCPEAYPLVSFGPNEGDTLLETSDQSSPPINLSIPLPFFGKNESIIHINKDGILSFREEFLNALPIPFVYTLTSVLIAPLWNPIANGRIHYRLSTNDSKLQQIVTTAFSLEDFEIKQTVVATYDRVQDYSSGTYSFQVVLVTDGEKSFVIFSYGDIIQQYSNANIGFNSGEKSYMLPGARTSAVLDVETSSNVGVAGLHLFRVDQECYIEQPSQDLCRELDDIRAPGESGILNSLIECTDLTGSGERNETIINTCTDTQTAHLFLPFGLAQGDAHLPATETTSPPINLTVPFPFLGASDQTKIYIHRNGILSFQDTGNFNRQRHLEYLDDAVIAPFWRRVYGYGYGNIYYRLSTSDSDFTKLQQILTTAFSLEDFEIAQTFVVTYDRPGFGGPIQVAFATDGEKSFVIFSYNKKNITNSNFGNIAGFNSGYRSYMLPGAFTSAVRDVETYSNVGVAGLYLFRVDQECYIEQPSQDLCQGFGAPADAGILNSLSECTGTSASAERRERMIKLCRLQTYPFVSFGPAQNDTHIPDVHERTIPPIHLTVQFPFLGRNETEIYIHPEGVLSFQQGSISSYSIKTPVIAPFWIDIFFVEYGGNIYYTLSRNDSDFTRLQQILTRAFSLEDFEITQTLVVTYGLTLSDDDDAYGTNSFQVVLATDGEKSFVIFSYGKIHFPYATIGFSSGDRFSELPGSSSWSVADIETTSNVGAAGLYLFRVDQDNVTLPSQDICKGSEIRPSSVPFLERCIHLINVAITASKELPVTLGDYLVLTCSISDASNSMYQFNWTHQDTLVAGETTPTLILPGVTTRELGEYICTVSTLMASGSASINITTKATIPRGAYSIKQSLSCPSQQTTTRDDITREVFQLLVEDFGVRPYGRLRAFPAASCQEIHHAHPDLEAGLYWITQEGGEPALMHCDA